MDGRKPEPMFEPVSAGFCAARYCTNPAKFRATWTQGIIVKLVCSTHKPQVEGKIFEEVGPSMFGSRPLAR